MQCLRQQTKRLAADEWMFTAGEAGQSEGLLDLCLF